MPSRKNELTDWVLRLPAPGGCSCGTSNNEKISYDGVCSHDRENEDRWLACSYQDKQLFMVLDGHEGARAVKFVHTHLPHFIFNSDFGSDSSSSRVMDAINSSVLKTETEFFISIDPYITRKVTLQIEIEQEVPDMNSSEAANLFPTQIAEICRLDDLIKSGTTVVLGLILHNRLFVANVGDSRALLCLHQPGKEGLMVKQLSVDHNTKNEDELRRLEKVGLNASTLRRNGRLGMQQNTRSIGDYSIKGGYTNMDILRHATSEPGSAVPHIHESIDISGSQGFILFMSDGLYKAYEEWSKRPDRINEDLAHLVAREFKNCQHGEDERLVAQNVVEKVKHLYKETHKRAMTPGRLDDITLIVKRLGLAHSQSMVISPASSTHPYGGDVLQTAPPGNDKPFDFSNGRQGYASVPKNMASYPDIMGSQQQPPLATFQHQPSLPPSSTYQSAVPEHHMSHTTRFEGGGAGAAVGMTHTAGDLPYSRQQLQPGVSGDYSYTSPQHGARQPQDNTDYYDSTNTKTSQYDSHYYRQQRQQDSLAMGNNAPLPPQDHSRMAHYPEASRHAIPQQSLPSGAGGNQVKGLPFQPHGGHPQSNIEVHGAGSGGSVSYNQQQDPGNRMSFQREGGGQSVPPVQEGYSSHGQGEMLQQQRPVHPTIPGLSSYMSNYGPSSGQGPHHQDSSYGQPHQGYRQTSAEDNPDLATPIATPRSYFANRQQSSSSFTSDASNSSSDLTLIRNTSMAAVEEADTLKEDDLFTQSRPPQGAAARAGENPHFKNIEEDSTQDSENPDVGYLSEEEEEEEVDNEEAQSASGSIGDDIRPYVKFGDDFPAELSWFEIPHTTNQ